MVSNNTFGLSPPGDAIDECKRNLERLKMSLCLIGLWMEQKRLSTKAT